MYGIFELSKLTSSAGTLDLGFDDLQSQHSSCAEDAVGHRSSGCLPAEAAPPAVILWIVHHRRQLTPEESNFAEFVHHRWTIGKTTPGEGRAEGQAFPRISTSVLLFRTHDIGRDFVGFYERIGRIPIIEGQWYSTAECHPQSTLALRSSDTTHQFLHHIGKQYDMQSIHWISTSPRPIELESRCYENIGVPLLQNHIWKRSREWRASSTTSKDPILRDLHGIGSTGSRASCI